MRQPILAGLIAGIPLALVFILYILVRGRQLAAFFRTQGDGMERIPERTLFLLLLAGFIGMAFAFGAAAGLVYGWLGMPRFAYVAAGATILFSILALISRQPLPADKIIWNLAVGGVLGALVPWLAK